MDFKVQAHVLHAVQTDHVEFHQKEFLYNFGLRVRIREDSKNPSCG